MAEGGAEYAFKNAQGNSDFSDAAKQYEKALLLAPWLAGDYFNCGVAHEKAGENKEALRSFNLYLLAAPNADDAQAVKKRIGGLQYAAQKAEAQADEAARKEADIRIGASHGGGIIFFVDGTGQHGRIAATADQGTGNWHNAVQLCRNYRGGGYSDWYMPSIIELGWLYEQKDVVGSFSQWSYWSSTEGFRGVAQNGVAVVIFETGTAKEHVNANYEGNLVRAIRAF